MKILILSPYYFPYINPRAHRWTSIAEYWVQQGHEIHVVCSKNKNYPSTQIINKVHIHRTGFNSLKEILYHFSKSETKRGEAGQKKANTGKKGSILQWINDKILRKLYFPDDAFMWYIPAKKLTRRLLKEGKFDLLISSSVPFTTHLVALNAQKNYPKLKWIADTGDPFAFQPLHPLNNYLLYGKLNKRLEQRVVRRADFVTLTNEGARKLYVDIFPTQEHKFKIIHPLYHAPNHEPSTVNCPSSIVKIGYFGSFFKNIREPFPMLQFWANFLEKYPEYQSNLELHFFGNIFDNFLIDFSSFPSFKKHIFIHGMLSKEEVAQKMQNMNFLQNVGNKTTFQLPSKATDYLATGKPIINFCSTIEDTFADFFKNYPLIINVLEDTKTEYEKVNDFLKDKLGKQIGEEERSLLLKKYYTETIATVYLDLLSSESND
ncbi:MAG: glycosyltransferase involved in cell wall biosynthesis [Saprospiraceae bacterium]|jgi:glycosyltransferase involved in cell wall biosynthesis